MVELAKTIWADGPSGTPLQPEKGKIRAWGTYLEGLANLAYTSGRVYASKAALLADLTPGANLSALVIGDATVGNDGLYMKNGATGVGSWTQLLDFVPGTQFVDATDVGAGTANAIQAATDIALSSTGRQIVALSVFENNTGAATVRFNGTGPAYPIKTNSGADVAADYLVGGSEVLGRISGAVFKLFTDTSSAADRAAAEAAASAAESAASAAAASAASIDFVVMADRTALKAADTAAHTAAFLKEAGRQGYFVFMLGDFSAQVAADTQEGVYVKANAIAATVGAWVRSYTRLSVEFFGASTSATRVANTTAIQAAVNFAQTYTGYLFFPALYSTSAAITVSNNIVLEGVSAFTSGISTNSGAAISLVPSTGIANNNTWYGIRYLSIISTDAGAFYGLNYTSSGSEYLSNWEMVGCYLSGTSGGASWDSSGSSVGIFSCTIRRNWFNNGLVIKDGGDSITILENTINGNGIGILVNALKTGARQLVIRNNNITTLSECVYLLNIPGGAIVESNWMETPSYLGSYTGGSGALCYVQASPNTRIIRNTIQPLASAGGGFVPAAYGIYLNTSGVKSRIEDNFIGIGGTGHIRIGAGIVGAFISASNNFDVSPVITDAGTGTYSVDLSFNSGIGYSSGAGGTVIQATSKSTLVTLNKACGQITMNAAALAAGTIVSFSMVNSAIAITDLLVLNHVSGGTLGAYSLNAACASGGAVIYVRNNTGGSLSEAIVISFAVIKAVTT